MARRAQHRAFPEQRLRKTWDGAEARLQDTLGKAHHNTERDRFTDTFFRVNDLTGGCSDTV
ncbi:MAG: hypothetical protein EOO27_44045 [Comamonadaceae bacterium]|nr:MAG: hypothetical protein EOO27_44045 [Comamonadaceae bacterium]